MAELTAAAPSAGAVVSAALDIGECLLKSGGEIHRVEDTIQRILEAFGMQETDVFVINSFITASAVSADSERVTLVRRIKDSQIDMYSLETANEVSRELCAHSITVEQAADRIKELAAANASKPLRVLFSLAGSFFAAGGFAVFFGGKLLDAAAAGIIGVIMCGFMLIKPSFINAMFQTLASAFIGGVLCYGLAALGLPIQANVLMMGVIMLLIPGLAMGNAVRELLVGDIISGSLRIVNSLLQAAMIAFGYIGAMLVFTKWLGI